MVNRALDIFGFNCRTMLAQLTFYAEPNLTPNPVNKFPWVWLYRKVHDGRVITFLKLADLTRQAGYILRLVHLGYSPGVLYRPRLTRRAGE